MKMINPINNIATYFFKQAKIFPERIAMVEKDQRLSYGQLAEEVMQMVSYYKAKGIKSGDRVLVFVPMSLDLYRSVLALFTMGATAVFVDEWADKNRLRQACELAQCSGFIGGWKARSYAWWEPTLRKIPIRLSPSRFNKYKPAKGIETVDLSQEALVTFTTGSTGQPKGAQRTHGFLAAQLKAIQASVDLKPGQVALSNLPIVQFIFLSAGMITILPNIDQRKLSALDADGLAEQLNKEKVELCIASPFIALALAKAKSPIPDLKELYVGGGAVFATDAQRLKTNFSQTKINIVYGSTEAEPISMVSAEELIQLDADNGLLVGKAHEFTKLEVVPIGTCYTEVESLAGISLPPGVIGEIVVAGDHVLDNYIGEKKQWMRQKIMVGNQLWHRTGDSGYLDEEGRIWLTGRCKQLIKVERHIIAPFLIEKQLATLPEILEGTVLRKDDALKVFVVSNAPLSANSRAHLNAWLSTDDYEIHRIRVMPKDARHHTKIDYGKLG